MTAVVRGCFVEWIKSQDWRQHFLVGLVQALIAILLVALVNFFVEDDLARDIGIIVVCVSVILAGGYAAAQIIVHAPNRQPNAPAHDYDNAMEATREAYNESEKIQLREQVENLRAERDELEQKHFEEIKRKLEGWQKIGELEPKAEWADRLIERERKYPLFEHPMIRCHVARANHLTDDQPYMDIVIEFPYRGVMKLVVGQEFKGKFGFNDVQFADLPQPEEQPLSNQSFPFEGAGPVGVFVLLRQYVFGRQDEIKQYILTHNTITLETKGMILSYRLQNPVDGTLIQEGNLLKGGELTVQCPNGN